MDVYEAGLASKAEESFGDMYGMDVGEERSRRQTRYCTSNLYFTCS